MDEHFLSKLDFYKELHNEQNGNNKKYKTNTHFGELFVADSGIKK